MADWFDLMAKAVKARDIAVAGRDRWQVKVTEAEKHIAELAAQRDAVPAVPGPEAQQEEVAAAVSPGLQTTLGFSSQSTIQMQG